MRIFADESVDKQIVDRLRDEGHAVEFVAEIEPGIGDDEVLLRSVESHAILLTADKDFGDLVFRQRRLHSGVLLLRFPGVEPHAKADLVARVLARHPREISAGFAVLSERALRIRQVGP